MNENVTSHMKQPCQYLSELQSIKAVTLNLRPSCIMPSTALHTMTVEHFSRTHSCVLAVTQNRVIWDVQSFLANVGTNKRNYLNWCKLKRLAEISVAKYFYFLQRRNLASVVHIWESLVMKHEHDSTGSKFSKFIQSSRLEALKIKSFCKSLETLEIAGCTTQQSQPWDWV